MNDAHVTRSEFYGTMVLVGFILLTMQLKIPQTFTGFVGPLYLGFTSIAMFVWSVRALSATSRVRPASDKTD